MGRKIVCLLLALMMFVCVGCSQKQAAAEEEKHQKKEEESISKLSEIIDSEIGLDSIEIKLDTSKGGKGKVGVTAYVPDYTEIFTEAFTHEDYEKALIDIINKKEYSTKEYFGFGNVKEENGKTVLDDEALIKSFMEKELIIAINAVLEQEGEK